jgi:hypothetical protein
MKEPRGRLFLPCGVALLAALVGIPPVLAQDGIREPPAPVSAESFRANFLQFLDAYSEVAAQMRDSVRQRQLADARRMIEGVSAEQIEQAFQGNLPDVQPLLAATEALRSHLASRAALAARQGPRLPTLPGRPGILGVCSGIVHDSTTAFVLLGVQQAADVLLAAAGRGCDQVAVVAGFGANTALVCLPLEIALSAAKVPYELAAFCAGEEDSSFLEGSFERLAHIHGDLETEAAGLRAQAEGLRVQADGNKTSIMDNDNANRTLIVNNANANTANIIANSNGNAAGITEAIKSGLDAAEARQIEDNLADKDCPAWMYTPLFLDAAETVRLGGRFERVVDVIRKAIDNARQLRSVHPFHLLTARLAADLAVAIASRRPPLFAKNICQLLEKAYEEATSSECGHDHSRDH